MEMRGYTRDHMLLILRDLTGRMPKYKSEAWYPARVWQAKGDEDYHLKSLFHAPGKIKPDPYVSPEEEAMLRAMSGSAVKRQKAKKLLMAMTEVDEELTEWIWLRYLAKGEISLIDGEKGVGKSTMWFDVAARGSRGDAMPGEDKPLCDPFKTVILSPENRLRNVIKPRLRAAEADMDMILAPRGIPEKKGKAPEMYLLPGSARKIAELVYLGDADFLIIDPITAFLEPNINSHNDASVRTALAPLAVNLAKLGCAAGFSRNMNKNQAQDAKYRGSGSAAFANLARVHLVAARLPDSYTGEGEFGLFQADVNLTRRKTEALTFSIVDSDDVALDIHGNMISRIKWHGVDGIGIDALTVIKKSGPDPYKQDTIAEVLIPMFEEDDTWDVNVVMAELDKAGVKADKETLGKARQKLGIIAKPVHKPGGGYAKWVWTTKTNKLRVGKK
jgi:hypothetical protein